MEILQEKKKKKMQSVVREMKILVWVLALCLFRIVCDAQAQTDFISIDCGLREGYNYTDDDTGIAYSTDAHFIGTGEIKEIPRSYVSNSLEQQLWTLRSFPDGKRNCYNLGSGAGEAELKGNKYLIRATFMYGNYDSMDKTPEFDLHLGVEYWTTIKLNFSNSLVREEIIHVPFSNFLYVCLVNTGLGTPFISALELRPLNQNAYPTDNDQSLANYFRSNFAPETDDEIIRYPYDVFDRIWKPHSKPSNWVGLSTMETIDNDDNDYQPPSTVMRTAATPRNASLPLEFYWEPPHPTEQFYVYFHFAEVQKLSSGESRQFYINLKDQIWYEDILSPNYLYTTTIFATTGNSEASFVYSLVKAKSSTLPPIINAMEVYMVKQFSQSQTNENDVLAVMNIKSSNGIKRSNWQGDPCLPRNYTWEGLDCTETIPPRIKFLNLSSSGLTGNVSLYLSNLTSLEYLDLSSNSLTGMVPDFLSELPSLKVLNLTGNMFSGSIPQKLVDKAKNGLTLRIEGFGNETPANHCESGDGSNQCKKEKPNKLVLAVVIISVVVASVIILAAFIVLRRIRRGSRSRNQVRKVGSESNSNDRFLESKRLRLTYANILEITNNFERILGKGSFGTVYHGVHSRNQVAVKVLSPSSVQGYSEFQTEAELLTRVHHRNLTTLVGYCYEDNKMALVYEYMANGNLRKLLSDNSNVLSWLGRLQIALDAAQGLDYLHNGCKPPIIHRDIKSTNILINEKLEAKLADFGLSRVFSEDGYFVSTRVIGTPGYVDPEYYRSHQLHEKCDIYSLGIVILELITGRPAMFRRKEDQQMLHITHWVSHLIVTADIKTIVDPKLKGDYDMNLAWKALEVAMACSSSSSSKRPAMGHVIKELSECLVAERARKTGLAACSSGSDFLEVNLVTGDNEPGAR